MRSIAFFVFMCAALTCLSCRKESPTGPPVSKGSISITEPKDSAIVLESVTIVIQVTSNQPVSDVELIMDGLAASAKIFSAPPYQSVWQTDTLPEGSTHELDAKGISQGWLMISSSPIHFTAYHFTPSNLSARMISDTLVALMWKDNSSKETAFDLQESINGGSFASIQQLPANSTTASVSGKYLIGDSLSFRVRALSDTLASNFSDTARVSIVFPAPTNALLLSLTDTEVQLSWRDNATFSVGFVIEHSTNGVTFSTLAVLGKNASPATVSDTFAIDSTHYFRVRARSTINTSVASNVVSTLLHGLNMPSGLSVTSAGNDTLILRWIDNVDYTKGYAIERLILRRSMD